MFSFQSCQLTKELDCDSLIRASTFGYLESLRSMAGKELAEFNCEMLARVTDAEHLETPDKHQLKAEINRKTVNFILGLSMDHNSLLSNLCRIVRDAKCQTQQRSCQQTLDSMRKLRVEIESMLRSSTVFVPSYDEMPAIETLTILYNQKELLEQQLNLFWGSIEASALKTISNLKMPLKEREDITKRVQDSITDRKYDASKFGSASDIAAELQSEVTDFYRNLHDVSFLISESCIFFSNFVSLLQHINSWQPDDVFARRIAFAILQTSSTGVVSFETIEQVVNSSVLKPIDQRFRGAFGDERRTAKWQLTKCLSDRYKEIARLERPKLIEERFRVAVNECTSIFFATVEQLRERIIQYSNGK